MKSIDELIGHVRDLITECNKKEFNEVSKHIESLNELSKYKNMEDKKTSSMETNLKENKSFKTDENVDNPTADNNNNKEKELLDAINKIEKPNLTDCCSCISFIMQFIFFVAVLLIILCFKDNDELIYYVLTIYFVICLIYSLYSLLACKYEYHAYMKDKELSNDLKKIYYQGKINNILKNKQS